MLVAMVGIAILMIFPTERLEANEPDFSKESVVTWLQVAAALSFSFWITEMPWFSSAVDQILSRDSLLDWRLILAVFLWCLTWGISMVRQAIALTNVEIVEIYSGCPSKDDPESNQSPP